MSMPSRRNRPMALRPVPETLEDRQLLSKVVTGTDIDGDTWTLKLTGPGDLRVINEPDAAGNPVPLGQPAQILRIQVAGADPQTTRLDGAVTQGPRGDGKVFFNNFTEQGGRSEHFAASNGIFLVNMPNFWLGNTSPSTSTNAPAPSINIPDGVVTFRFGGADSTVNVTPTQTTPNNLAINLGLPETIGTSLIVDKMITGARQIPGTGTSPATTVQDSIVVTVDGRLNMFQANEIDGNAAFPSSGFTGGQFGSPGGGTIVVSTIDQATQTTGQIGFIRVGGNATNFSVQTNDKVSDFFIGGETNNVLLLAPGGSRNVHFGKGMDDVTIDSHVIDNLFANRGALNSNVTTNSAIGRALFGGDVVGTNVLSGYSINLPAIFSNQQAPTTPPGAQDGGGMTVLVAGDIRDSVFAASTDPQNGVFGTNDLTIPHSHITAKVEGTVDNTHATPDAPGQAFYAQGVQVFKGPVTPPIVPEAPFAFDEFHRGQNGLKGRDPLAFPVRHTPVRTTTPTTGTGGTATTTGARAAALVAGRQAAHPQGPLHTQKKSY